MKALFMETKVRSAEYTNYNVVSIFIGGGTPSVVQAKWIEELMQIIFAYYHVRQNAEITIEVNPGTVDEDKLKCYRRAGINRLSIGLQSVADEELKAIGRIHCYKDFAETYESAGKVGFENVNVDVMSALPGQTSVSYRHTLQTLLKLSPPPKHISAYSLIVEEETPFFEMQREGRLNLPDEDTERAMYVETERILSQAGYHRYEISNYALEGYECAHNCGYWNRREYAGFGIGAASLIDNERFSNNRNLQEYLSNPVECHVERQKLSRTEQMEEFMFLGLRLTKGVRCLSFQQIFGTTLEEIYGTVIGQNVEDGLLHYHMESASGERFLALTDKGLDVSNYVMAQFLLD